MKFSTATLLLAISTISSAAPASLLARSDLAARSDSTAQQIFDSINAWINDVDNVNTFLDQAGADGSGLQGTALASAAQTALNNASDEPTQLGIQSNLSNLSSAGQAAVSALQNNFGNVKSSLAAIISNPSDSGTVQGNLQIINGARCNIVLPSLDILWPAAAAASGATAVTFTAQRPDTC